MSEKEALPPLPEDINRLFVEQTAHINGEERLTEYAKLYGEREKLLHTNINDIVHGEINDKRRACRDSLENIDLSAAAFGAMVCETALPYPSVDRAEVALRMLESFQHSYGTTVNLLASTEFETIPDDSQRSATLGKLKYLCNGGHTMLRHEVANIYRGIARKYTQLLAEETGQKSVFARQKFRYNLSHSKFRIQ